MEDIGQGQGAFSEWGMFVNAICHFEAVTVLTIYMYESMRVFFYQQIYVSHVWNPCLRQSEPGKLFQICDIIYINGKYMIRGGGIFRTGGV